MPPVYVILAPEPIKGIYTTWDECRAKVTGVSGATFQKVLSRDAAQAMLDGTLDRIPPGTFAFVDGNHRGGVGVVLVHRTAEGRPTRKEISTTLTEVFPQGSRWRTADTSVRTRRWRRSGTLRASWRQRTWPCSESSRTRA